LAGPLAPSSFIEFQDRPEILRRLRTIDIHTPEFDPLFEPIAERLNSRAYDRSAFVFILIELIYDFEGLVNDFGDLLGRLVFALTGDLDLVGESLEAFEEICQTIDPSFVPAVKSTQRSLFAARPFDPSEEARDDRERLMVELQRAQKRIADFGLKTRLSIESALVRPTRENVGLTLREISDLRASLLHFESLLRGSEERILEAIGLLDLD
jgi:hypothetical protein